MTALRQAAQAALEALRYGVRTINHLGGAIEAVPLHDAIDALSTALAEPQPEPVAFDADSFMREFEWAKWSDCRDMVEHAYEKGRSSAAPQAQQPLTDEQIIELWLPINRDAPHASNGALQIARAIERAIGVGVKP